MSTLYERLSTLCKQRGIKGGRMCVDLGFSKSLMTDLKSGRKKTINAETAHKIATYFGVSVAYLLGEEEIKKEPVANCDELPEDVQAIMSLLKDLSEEKAKLLLPMIKAAVEAD